jgi:hypothetical protein
MTKCGTGFAETLENRFIQLFNKEVMSSNRKSGRDVKVLLVFSMAIVIPSDKPE